MIGNRSVLAIIPARGGSKGVKRKNIRPVAGKPLLAWSVEAAKQSAFIDRLVLSSEDPEIISVAQSCGCDVPFVRPKELSEDHVQGGKPVVHALEMLPGYDYVVLLQPTSPLRTAEDIDACIAMCIEKDAPVCVSVCKAAQPPYWMYSMRDNGTMIPLLEKPNTAGSTQRQDLPVFYALNGAVYVARTDWFMQHRTFMSEQTVAYCMPPERSIDIDSELDLQFSELLLRKIHEPGFIS